LQAFSLVEADKAKRQQTAKFGAALLGVHAVGL